MKGVLDELQVGRKIGRKREALNKWSVRDRPLLLARGREILKKAVWEERFSA